MYQLVGTAFGEFQVWGEVGVWRGECGQDVAFYSCKDGLSDGALTSDNQSPWGNFYNLLCPDGAGRYLSLSKPDFHFLYPIILAPALRFKPE